VHDEQTGVLLAIGGAEDRFRDRIILRRFVQLAGGENARIVIVPTASSMPDAGEHYTTIFRELGAARADLAVVRHRDDAERDDWVCLIEQSTGIFLTGGNQLRVASILGGTRLVEAIRTRHDGGVPIAGTSAGASVMSTVMVAGGRGGSTPQQQMVQMAPGLGLIDRVIIDQHFRERDRVGRLVTMVSYNPGLIGIGIDEDTAAIFHPDNTVEALGRGSILIVDGAQMRSNVYATHSSKALSIADVVIHFLSHGGCYDLRERTVTRLA
jgi:cyanophycinase